MLGEDGREAGGEVKVTALDAIVESKMRMAQRKGRGFTLDLAESAGLVPPVDGEPAEGGGAAGSRRGLTITVKEELPPLDEYEKPTDWRNHTVEDADSFVTYAMRYGKTEKSLILYNDNCAVLSIDEEREAGKRELCTLNFRFSDEWRAWVDIFGKVLTHKAMLNHLTVFQQNLIDLPLLESMRSIKSTSTIKQQSDLRVNENQIGVTFTATGGEEIVNFPRKLNVAIPVLEIDIEATSVWARLEVRVDVILPTKSEESVSFRLFAPQLLAERRKRINSELAKIRTDLVGWTVVRGAFAESPRQVGRKPEQNAYSYEQQLKAAIA